MESDVLTLEQLAARLQAHLHETVSGLRAIVSDSRIDAATKRRAEQALREYREIAPKSDEAT